VSKYKLFKLVYYEISNSKEAIFQREKQIKNWKRDWKIKLIEKKNPNWENLLENL
jgi:putative endonuclease